MKRLSIDLSEKQNTPVVYAVQGEKNSRKIRFDLFHSGVQWEIDQNASVLISYKKPDGHGGMYDVLDNGESAFEFSTDSTNSVIITLAEQVLTTVGNVPLLVSFVVDNKILSTFNISLYVSENPGSGLIESKHYFAISAVIDAAVIAAQQPVKVITVSEDENGEYKSDYDFETIVSMKNQGIPFVCFWYDESVNTQLVDYHDDTLVFSAVSLEIQYNVLFNANGSINCTAIRLAKYSDIQNTPTIQPVTLQLTKGSYDIKKHQIVTEIKYNVLNNYITKEASYYDNITIKLVSDNILVRVIYVDENGGYLEATPWMSRTKTQYTDGGIDVYYIKNSYAYISFADHTKDPEDLSYTATAVDMLRMVEVYSTIDENNTLTSSPFQGKALITFGDSITWLNDNGRVGYQTNLKSIFGLSRYLNKGVSGASISTISASHGYEPIVDTVLSYTDFGEYDLITVFGGTNDFKMNASIGTIGQIGDTEFDTTTFYGGYRAIIEHILTAKPTARLLLITPLQRNKDDYNSWNTTNSAGHSLKDYVDAVKKLGEMYSLPVVDLFHESGFNKLTLSTFTYDGLHPNDNGFVRVANCIAGEMVKSGL